MGDPLPDAVDASLVESALLDHVRSINPLCCARGPAAHGVLPQAQQHTLHDADDPQQTYLALLREVAALHDALQPQSRGEEERDDPPPPPPGGDVQHAVLTQRLQDLQRQQAAMEAATPSLVSIAKQAEQRRREREKRAKGKQKTKGGKVQRGSDDMFADATRGAALLETERDNLIRLGVVTPFDALEGFERRVVRVGGPDQPGTGSTSQTTSNGDPFTRAAAKFQEIEANRHRAKLLDVTEVVIPERPPQRVPEHYWRQAASGSTPQARLPRRSTLPRLGKRRLSGGAQADGDVLIGDEAPPTEEEDAMEDDDVGDSENAGDDRDDQEAHGTDDVSEEQWTKRRLAFQRAGDGEEVQFEGGLRVPAKVYDCLFPYQQTAIKWMWELHTQRAGGIIGDEMGLGKTVQVIAFLGGLHHSGLYRPSLVVCPATVMHQWIKELHKWYPPFRVLLLHDSARSQGGQLRPTRRDLVTLATSCSAGLLVTSYDQLRRNRDLLLDVEWGYAVLDEGHKIRNPDADITLVAKQLQTVHRVIMSGSPIQNRLTELWSLFDFIFPGKLGTLPVFQTEFALPIQLGGYANASSVQDVGSQLPSKTEQVLFCQLTPAQRKVYRAYISSQEVSDILEGTRNALVGIDILRKVCNHPDLLERASHATLPDYGNPERSGKLGVALRVLQHWQQQDCKVLVFTQTQQMLDIMEKMVQGLRMTYRRMDGGTSVAVRARLVDDFNTNADVFVFLLTTKVGGLGVNLTGANRVLLYDPDWNPSTDVQARERAWRIGQSREVVIYRLITRGTIEEKVYHRQIYKHFLTDKVLRDPRQRRLFKAKDMADLFTLGPQYDDGAPTETEQLFAEHAVGVSVPVAEDGAPEEEGDEDGPALQGPTHDAKLLQDLFSENGVAGAVDHNVVEDAGSGTLVAVDQEAARVAAEAARRLRASRVLRQAAPVHAPTWTGRSGSAGDPTASRFGATSMHRSGEVPSHNLLGRIRAQQEALRNATDDPALSAAQQVVTQVTAFLQARGGRALSAALVEHFQSAVPPEQVPLFKQALKQVAVKHTARGQVFWQLKEEDMFAGALP